MVKRIVKNIKEKITPKTGSIGRNIVANARGVISRNNQFAKPRQIKLVLVAIIIIFGVFNFVFGVSVYAYRSDSDVVKIFSDILQFPSIYSSTGTISVGEYLHNKKYVEHFYNATEQGEINEEDLNMQIRDQLIENRIIDDAAAKYKIALTKEEKDLAVNQIVDENGGVEEVEKVLDELYGLSLKQFKKLINSQLLREKINNELIQRVEARHILIRTADDATEDQLNEAKSRITHVRDEIMAGKDFSEAAKESSEDVGSNESGGSLGSFARGEMVKEFENTAFSATIGEISEPVKTSFGWHLIVVDNKVGEIDQSFPDWIEAIKDEMITVTLY